MTPEPPPIITAKPARASSTSTSRAPTAESLVESRRTEHVHARLHEFEALDGAQELEEYPHHALEAGFARTAPGKEGLLGALDVGQEPPALRPGGGVLPFMVLAVAVVPAGTTRPDRAQFDDPGRDDRMIGYATLGTNDLGRATRFYGA